MLPIGKPLMGLLALLAGCGHLAPEYSPAPGRLLSATEVPARPDDPDDPWARVLWTMNYDLRELDATWAWLLDEATPGLERDRAMGAAALLGVAELDRFDLLDAGVEALTLAIAADPSDGRLPSWRAYLITLQAMRAGDAEATAAGYERLRAATSAYPSFSIFGVTLAVAGDPHATPELIAEALGEYDRLSVDYGELQYSDDPRDHRRSSRLGDWASAPYNMPGTQALMGDMAARAGFGDRATQHWYIALNANEAYRWPFRAELLERLELGPEAVAAAIEAGELMPLGARHVGAIATPEPYRDPRFDGRIGNGSCTICHTRLSAFDDPSGESDILAVGWIRGTMVLPADVPNPTPNLFALPDPETIPTGFMLGRVVWDQRLQRTPMPVPEPGAEIEYMIPVRPGKVFVAGRIGVSDRIDYQGYLARGLRRPRYIEVRAGEIADITGGRPLVFAAAE
jgi:hypothetical protein